MNIESDGLNDLGKRLKLLRLENNMTQAKLGKKLGASGSAVSSYETLKCIPDYYVLKAYLEYFEVDAFWLMTGRVRERTAVTMVDEGGRKLYMVYSGDNPQIHHALNRIR